MIWTKFEDKKIPNGLQTFLCLDTSHLPPVIRWGIDGGLLYQCHEEESKLACISLRAIHSSSISMDEDVMVNKFELSKEVRIPLNHGYWINAKEIADSKDFVSFRDQTPESGNYVIITYQSGEKRDTTKFKIAQFVADELSPSDFMTNERVPMFISITHVEDPDIKEKIERLGFYEHLYKEYSCYTHPTYFTNDMFSETKWLALPKSLKEEKCLIEEHS